ncbi:MAG: hypothetical protein DLM53_11055 [Candidatus Eremiobacter antarcticus]|nr:MAG: hypothetical protein DLM53_11055 [Candidatus Eremiobacter sp. RRmetagenome_bin22]
MPARTSLPAGRKARSGRYVPPSRCSSLGFRATAVHFGRLPCCSPRWSPRARSIRSQATSWPQDSSSHTRDSACSCWRPGTRLASPAMDEMLLSKIRLSVIAELLNAEWVAFSELQRATEASNGNLGAHLGKLLEAGYVAEEKTFVNRRPQTRYRLTKKGRNAFVGHVALMQKLLKEHKAS